MGRYLNLDTDWGQISASMLRVFPSASTVGYTAASEHFFSRGASRTAPSPVTQATGVQPSREKRGCHQREGRCSHPIPFFFQTSATPMHLHLETAPEKLTERNKGDEPVHCEKCFNGACTASEVTLRQEEEHNTDREVLNERVHTALNKIYRCSYA